MSARGCLVPLSGEAGTGLCGWETEQRTGMCAAHRRRRWLTGDPQGHVPVVRKPSRRPDVVAARLTEQAARRAEAIRRRFEQDAARLEQLETRDRVARLARRTTASLA